MPNTDLCPFAAVTDPRRLAWALLPPAARGPSKTFWHLVDELGVEQAATVLSTGAVTGEVDPAVLARSDPDRAAAG
ncbi:hypothetical protein ACTD5D_22110 [Nocardia takedensis]|uniref:hypothetical protein n=1 Tax=Nocardia takedensis TaxID=259390 RepID=UPI0002E35EF5|nr:hypothetical protein [Nocardia takedensis]